jgi:adenylate kinase family enzyme
MKTNCFDSYDTSFKVLAGLIQARIRASIGENEKTVTSLPALPSSKSLLATFAQENKLRTEEQYLLLIALAPHIKPAFFDQAIQQALPKAGDFPQIGGVRGKQFRGFIPTGETVSFILAGEQNGNGQELMHRLFDRDHCFAQKRVLWIEPPPEGEPLLSGKLVMNPSYILYFTTGKEYLPLYNSQFPAVQLKTALDWKDIVLNQHTLLQIDELRAWLHHSKKLMQQLGMAKKLPPGYRALFYGPPGTGKTLCATLLGKEFKRTVFRVDLSTIVSKYIGETEKNLARLFDEAEHQNWILFFDEADALFGKRTQVKDAHDRYANQEVSYLMQRIESFNGLVILASNLKGNMDEAFTRRFQSIIFFPYPTPEEQLLIWQKAFPKKLQPCSNVDLSGLSHRYKLSGANIMNIVQYCCLTSLSMKKKEISQELLLQGIQRELQKEGKTF